VVVDHTSAPQCFPACRAQVPPLPLKPSGG
jgi:hypothetical protein